MDRAPTIIEASVLAENGTVASTPSRLPTHAGLLTRTGWAAFLVALVLVCAVAAPRVGDGGRRPRQELFRRLPDGAFRLLPLLVGDRGSILTETDS